MNSNGARFGFGGLGFRGGCPICETPISFWFVSKKAADRPIFWMHRIQACMEQIGPRGGPIPIQRIKKMLHKGFSLTSEQKKILREKLKNSTDENGFFQALMKGGEGPWVNMVVDGGPARGSSIQSKYQSGIWRYDRVKKSLILGKWE